METEVSQNIEYALKQQAKPAVKGHRPGEHPAYPQDAGEEDHIKDGYDCKQQHAGQPAELQDGYGQKIVIGVMLRQYIP